jgi:tetratricopeptide (TPR) repeat protein
LTQVATLDAQAARLSALVKPGISLSSINRCTDFAIDANDAGRADLTIALLAPLTALASESARVWQVLALAYRQMQQSSEALAAFERAATLAPRDARVANGYATAVFEAGLPSAALFAMARALSPGDAELVLSHAAALLAEDRSNEAEALIEPIVADNPVWVRGHEALANLRWTMGEQSDFDRSFAQAARVIPGDMVLRFAWHRALSQVGRWDDATDVIARGRALAGDLREFDAAEAYISTERGDDARAEILFARAAALNDPGTMVSHIRHCLRTGRIDQAEQIAIPMLKSPAAAMVWPYMSLIWRLKDNARAAWLDGTPPFIRSFDLSFSSDVLGSLAVCLRRLHQTRHHPAEQSLRGGTQTDGPLFARLDPEIQDVRRKVLEAVRTYVDGLPPHDAGHPLLFAPRRSLLFAGAWSVRLRAQGFHIVHTHPRGWISSALYVALPESMGAAPAGWLQLGAPPPDLRIDLPAYTQIEPKPGRLVLFPSTMWHGTVPFNDGERLTIAFDVAVPDR